MTAAQIVPIVITVLVPIVTAMAGILGVTLQDWRVRKSQAGRRKLALEDASSQVSFAADWWNAKKLIADSPEVVQEAQKCVQDWLEEASARVIGSELPTARQRSPITLRRLLLFYPLQGRIANLIRGCFYVSLGVLISFVGFTISDVLESHQYLADDFINLIVFAILTLALRFWAVSAQNPESETHRTRPKRFRRALLLYRLHRGTASLVRIIFYGWTIFVVWSAQDFANIARKDIERLPGQLTLLIALIGWAVGLRYWAASLARTPDIGKANDQHPAETTVFVAEESSTKNWWDSLPDQNRLQSHWRQS